VTALSPELLTIEHHGAALYKGAASSIPGPLGALLAGLPANRAGLRVHGAAWLEG
jgi:hypothetical protein